MKEKILEKHFENSNKTFDVKDAVLIGFHEDLLAKLESLLILIENNAGAATDHISRSIFENYVYLYYLLHDNKLTKLKAESYYLKSKTEEYKTYKEFIAEDQAGEAIRGLLEVDIKEMKKETNYVDVDKEIEKLNEKYHKVLEYRAENQSWYYPYGKNKNFYLLCRKLGLLGEYKTTYQLLSDETHSRNVLKRFNFTKEKEIYLMTNPYDNQMQLDMAHSLLLDITVKLLEHYKMSRDLKAFRLKLKTLYYKKTFK